jgi:hypothetical protein
LVFVFVFFGLCISSYRSNEIPGALLTCSSSFLFYLDKRIIIF